jgi:hypothetical protein
MTRECAMHPAWAKHRAGAQRHCAGDVPEESASFGAARIALQIHR